MKLKLVKEINIDYANVKLFSPALVRMEITADLVITSEEAKELNEIIGELSEGKEIAFMLLANDATQFDSSAREFSASEEGFKYKKAEALVVRTLAHKLIAELYLKINKPIKSSKAFTNEEDAVDWLLTF